MGWRLDEFHQKLIALLVLGGAIALFFGVFFIAFYGPIFIALGALSITSGVVYGISIVLVTRRGPEKLVRNCRIMARYGVDKRNEVLASDWVNDADVFRPHIRIWSPNDGAYELECALPVWEQCGEGMLGDAVIQGRWLCSFTVRPPGMPQG